VRAVTADEIRRVQAEVRALVREQALRRARGSALAARGISDFARFNRAEGVALGAGLKAQFGRGFTASAQGRYGFEDREAKGHAELGWQNARGDALLVRASRDYQDVGDVPERSGLVNSIAAQEFGSDYTDLFRVEKWGAALTTTAGGFSWTLDISSERHDGLVNRATPSSGMFEPEVPADSFRAMRTRFVGTRPTILWYGGLELRAGIGLNVLNIESDAPSSAASIHGGTTVRGSADLELQRPVGRLRILSRTIGAAVTGTGQIPVQELVFMGGPITAPGYDYHSLIGNAAISQRLELQAPVPFPSISLGRFGRSAARATLAPFATAVKLVQSDVNGPSSVPAPAPPFVRVFRRQTAIYPTAGLGLLLFFDLLRLDVARGLKDGRWSFYIDVTRAFWSVL
jgi:hypothetical protein